MSNSDSETVNGNGMAVAMKRRRALSPAPGRGTRGAIHLGDVSKAAVAGTPEAQAMQAPYLEDFFACLKRHYPDPKTIAAPRKKLGGFAVAVHCWKRDGWDPSDVASKVKAEFKRANVRNDGTNEYEWFIPYVKPGEKKALGTQMYKLSLIGVLLTILIWLLSQRSG